MKYHDIFWVMASSEDRAWNALLALGNIAFAYTFADVLIETQNTLKSPPAKNKTMKKATFYGAGLTTIFYLTLGCTGYAAFGNNAPGNILTGFGFYEPFWLIDIANICIIVHLLGAYQGGSKIQKAYLIFQYFSKKYQMSGMILNGQAVCCVHKGRFDGS